MRRVKQLLLVLVVAAATWVSTSSAMALTATPTIREAINAATYTANAYCQLYEDDLIDPLGGVVVTQRCVYDPYPPSCSVDWSWSPAKIFCKARFWERRYTKNPPWAVCVQNMWLWKINGNVTRVYPTGGWNCSGNWGGPWSARAT